MCTNNTTYSRVLITPHYVGYFKRRENLHDDFPVVFEIFFSNVFLRRSFRKRYYQTSIQCDITILTANSSENVIVFIWWVESKYWKDLNDKKALKCWKNQKRHKKKKKIWKLKHYCLWFVDVFIDIIIIYHKLLLI